MPTGQTILNWVIGTCFVCVMVTATCLLIAALFVAFWKFVKEFSE